jgi:hypothetical protein
LNICQERDLQEIASRRTEKAGINATFRHTSISDLLFMYNEQLYIHKLVTPQRTVFIIYIPKNRLANSDIAVQKITAIKRRQLTLSRVITNRL